MRGLCHSDHWKSGEEIHFRSISQFPSPQLSPCNDHHHEAPEMDGGKEKEKMGYLPVPPPMLAAPHARPVVSCQKKIIMLSSGLLEMVED